MPSGTFNFGSEGSRTIQFSLSFASPTDSAGKGLRRIGDPSGATIRIDGLFEGQQIQLLNILADTGAIGNDSGLIATSKGCFELVSDQTPIQNMPLGIYDTVLRVFQPNSNTQFVTLTDLASFEIVAQATLLPPNDDMPAGEIGGSEGDRVTIIFNVPGAPELPTSLVQNGEQLAPVESRIFAAIDNMTLFAIGGALIILALALGSKGGK